MSNDNLPTAAPSPFDDEPQIEIVQAGSAVVKPRLSILHLMVWTATSAAMMALLRLPHNIEARLGAVETISRIVFSMYGGLVLGGVVMTISRRWRGLSFPTEPGEWLLLMQGETVLVTVVLGFILGPMVPRDPVSEIPLVLTMLLAFALIGLIPALRYRGNGPWRWFLIAFAAMYVTPLVGGLILIVGGYFLFGLFGILWLVTLIVSVIILMVAVASDLWRRIVRGWVHWTGVWSLVVLLTLYAITFAAAALS